MDDDDAVLTWQSKYEETLQALRNRYPGELDSTPMDRYLGMGFSYNPDTGAMTASMYDSNPTQGDQIKVIRLLAYFRVCQDLGPTWFTTEGPILVASCDAVFPVHPTTGGSQLSISFHIGSDNASFHVISKIQTTKISLNPTHSEYNAFSIATEHIKVYRRYLAWLGYPQRDPTPLENDCAPAFSILTAPSFPKNSKNLLVQDRNVREAYRDQILTPVHVLFRPQCEAMWTYGLPGQENCPPQHQNQPCLCQVPLIPGLSSFIFVLFILNTQMLLIFARWHVSTKIYLSGA